MAKKKDLMEMQATLDNREAEKVVTAAKAAEDDRIRDEVLGSLKEKAETLDYPRLLKENQELMDRVLELERRLRVDDETEDDLPEEVLDEVKPELEEKPEPKKPEPTKEKPAPVMVHSPKPKRQEVKPTKEPEAKPVKQEAKPLNIVAEPGVLPGPAPALQPALTPASAPTSVAFRHDGPGKAYKYWSYKDRCFKLTSDVWIAQQFGQDTWEPVWVWYRDGGIHHLLSERECEEYLPR